MDPLYTTEALSTGGGRNGHVEVAGTDLAFDLAAPEGLGGKGDGYNPEQFFAAGYAACFHGALQAVARSKKAELGDSSVGAKVTIGSDGNGGFELAVKLEVVIPDLPHDEAQALADQAHQVCPYSRATRGNIEVEVTVVDD